MLARAGTGDYHTLLTTAKGLRAATSWLIRAGVPAQFSTAKEMGEKDRGRIRNRKDGSTAARSSRRTQRPRFSREGAGFALSRGDNACVGQLDPDQAIK
jgi:hypothetical protein